MSIAPCTCVHLSGARTLILDIAESKRESQLCIRVYASRMRIHIFIYWLLRRCL